MYRKVLFGSLLVISFVLGQGLLSAGPILGSFGFSGPGELTFKLTTTGNPDFINFCTNADATCATNPPVGDFGVSGPGMGSFNVLTNTDTGHIDSLTDVNPPQLGFQYLPPGGPPVAINNFLTLTPRPQWNFQANVLPLASCPTTATQICTGPFVLSQNGVNVSVLLNVFGTIIDTTDNSQSAFNLTIAGQFLNTTIGAVAAEANTPAGVLTDSWSGSLNARATPEPGTFVMLAAGSLFFLVGIGLQRRKGRIQG